MKRDPRRLGGVSREVLLLVGAVVGFLAITVWWLTQDNRVQDWDNGLHTVDAFLIHKEIVAGHLTTPFTEFNTYPPLGHLVGALAVFIGGFNPATVIVASNAVFVPLLAAGCFGVGRQVYGSDRAGLLAALFALGTPMIVSEFHEFILDPQQAALIAVSVWAILACRRFERPGIAALAGTLSGLAMLTKQTSIVFLAGPLAVAVLRGGWRNGRGILAFAGALAVVAGPWYVYHGHELNGLVSVHDSGAGSSAASEAGGFFPQRLSRKSFGWYFWSTLNIQVLAPLALALLIGTVLAIRDCLRDRSPNNPRPELLGGLFVSWLGMTLITHKDPRYSLPALVYMAVLGAGWIAVAGRGRRLLEGALVFVVAINVIGVSTGLGSTIRLTLPGGSKIKTGLAERHLTFYSPDGWLRGAPEHDGNILALLQGLKRVGVRTVTFDAASSDDIDFNTSGLQVLAIDAGLEPKWVYSPTALGPRDAFVLRHVRQSDDPPPCQRLKDGSGVYVVLGSPVIPFELYTFLCPGRRPLFYKRTAPLSLATRIELHPDITGSSRALLLNVMLGLRKHGARTLEFDRASADKPFFQPTGLERLAAVAQLPVPPVTPRQFTPRDAFLLRRPIGPGGPRACGRFPDDTGLFVVLGDPLAAHPRYYCPRGHA